MLAVERTLAGRIDALSKAIGIPISQWGWLYAVEPAVFGPERSACESSSKKATAEQHRNAQNHREGYSGFLASGKKIQVIPMGVSGQDKMGRSKNIVISRKRRAAIR